MFKNKNDVKITLTKEEYREKVANVLAEPIPKEAQEETDAHTNLALMMAGMLLFQQLEKKLFGDDE